ncbi:MAG TPA: PIN domain-containing protein [Rhizomicrobium sp.]|jgi:predicted nucleic acid-binding protein|nr:PIN domain-containing protein [Rhizomicrobium sp.]
MKVALDTNVLVYAEGLNGADKRKTILDILDGVAPDNRVISVHVLGELFRVLTRKARLPASDARAVVLKWRGTAEIVEASEASMLRAIDLVVDHRLPIRDSAILVAAAVRRCNLLLTEGIEDGFVWSGVTVVDPFRTPMHPLLADALRR